MTGLHGVPMTMPCTASTLGSLIILLMLLLLLVVWLLRVVPVRKLQLHVCYPAGLGGGNGTCRRESWGFLRKRRGVYADN